MANEVELKPCPFCGPGRSSIELYQDANQMWLVGCGRCGCHGGALPIGSRSSKERIVATWNERAYDWQPIESAPKDGTHILGARFDLIMGTTLQTIRDTFYASKTSEWANYDNDDFLPTHWMPLPPIPKANK